MFDNIIKFLKFVFKRVTKLSIPYFSLGENNLRFKITSEFIYKYPLSSMETKTRYDSYVISAYTLKMDDLYLEYIETYVDTTWSGDAFSLFISLLKDEISAKRFDLVEEYIYPHYVFRTYFVDNSYYLNLVFIYENSKNIFIIDKKESLFTPLLRSFMKTYDFDFKNKFNNNLDFNFSLVKKNAINNYFRVTSS
ncbi:hypothetical protein CRU87_07765 [Aliarcobacter trophiarum LMG 25534]|uniref:Uncharacterized protein n=1 Tax=Aliarcobacter trophiarum LMG 25534 TaxID=1032241 RepID=A0AAD0VLK5_9BACT|nr:hypothetical protein [Aliarcobacter trophiarum]AXK47985.1 hypothetical protein ATR_0092 [Aliarcobacter trophiarum LMG 25534]RXJ90067.1 hypothetical protein CRU87_07765 [Aliarcobacter trophiarum LMG 25534]